MSGEVIVEAARTWLGTPFQWGAEAKDLGCDCVGLVLGVGRELGLTDYRPRNYGRQWDNQDLYAALNRIFDRIYLCPAPGAQVMAPPALSAGDVLLFTVRRRPQHLAIATGPGMMIHADELTGHVVENSLTEHWWRRLWAIYRFRGVAENA